MVSRRQRRAAGFTLTEVMVVVGILAVLAAVAAPSMNAIIETQRARAGQSDLFTSLLLARSEAVKRNMEVTITPADASNWALGWSTAHPTKTGTMLDSHGRLVSIAISGPGSVVFQPSGRVKGGTALEFEIATSKSKRCLQVDLSGRPYQTNKPC